MHAWTSVASLPNLIAALSMLGCSTRLSMLIALSREPLDVSTIAHRLDLSMPLLSNHLKLLRVAGMVDFHTFKSRRIYRLSSIVSVSVTRDIAISVRTGDGGQISVAVPLASPLARQCRQAMESLGVRLPEVPQSPIAR